MKVTRNLPEDHVDAVDGGLVPVSVAGQQNFVIENFTELAAAGMAGICQICWADCAAPRIP